MQHSLRALESTFGTVRLLGIARGIATPTTGDSLSMPLYSTPFDLSPNDVIPVPSSRRKTRMKRLLLCSLIVFFLRNSSPIVYGHCLRNKRLIKDPRTIHFGLEDHLLTMGVDHVATNLPRRFFTPHPGG